MFDAEDDSDRPVAGRDDGEESGPGERSVDDLTVKRLLQQCTEDWRRRLSVFEPDALRNERYIHGEQFHDTKTDAEKNSAGSWRKSIPKIHRNYLRKLVLTYASRIEEESGVVRAWPAESSDIEKAEVANAVIEHLLYQQDMPTIMFRAAVLAQAHGMVGIKASWDPSSGPKSPWTGEPMGTVAWDLVDMMSFGVSNDEHIEHARWCFFKRPIDYYESMHLLEEAGIDEKPGKEHGEGGGEEEDAEVMVYELWHRPGPRIPEGLYAVTVGGHVVDARPFPYDHGELPLSIWKIGDRRDSSFGSTHVDDAVPMQVYVNQLVSVIAKLTWDVGDVRLVGMPAIIDKMRGENHLIKVTDVDMVQRGVKWLEPPTPPPLVFSQLEETITAMHDLFGLNEALLGRAQTDQSGKAIAYLNRLDGMGLRGALLNRNKCVQRYIRQGLALFQQYADEERTVSVVGEGSRFKAKTFTGADLAGLDILLEDAPRAEHSRTVRAEKNDQLGQAGALPPDAWHEQSRTGLDETAFAGVQRQMVHAQAQAAMQGMPQQADQTIDPIVAIQELARAAAQVVSMGYGPQSPALQALYALAAQYRQVAQQQGMPQSGQPSGEMPEGQFDEFTGQLQ